jgi:long-chain acyl-CoA synthetase
MGETLPGLLAARAERTPRGVALRQKRLGIWQETSWQEHHARVRAVAAELAAAGLRPGDVVALLGGHRPQWLQAELGIQAAGAAVAPLDEHRSPALLADLLARCNARFAVVEGQEQVDTLLAARDRVPTLERVFYWDPRGMRAYQADPWLQPLRALRTGTVTFAVSGRTAPAPGAPRRPSPPSPSPACGRGVAEGRGEGSPALPAINAQDVAAVLFTPGLGGRPRAVRLTHAALIAAARALVEAEGLDARGEFVSFAPAGWIGERAFATAAALVAGYTVNLPEEPDTVPENIQEIGPRLLMAPPPVWERLMATAQARVAAAGRLRRSLIRWALTISTRVAACRQTGRAVEPTLRVRAWLADWLICRPVRDHLGLLRVRRAYSAGAALPVETERFFSAIGVPLRQLYTLTAAGGAVAVHDGRGFRALPGVELRVSADGELCVRAPWLADASLEAGEPVLAADGWLHTGDAARAEPDGAVTLLDRLAHLARLADGTAVVPAQVEAHLTASPYLRHAVVVAEGRPYVTALVVLDRPSVSVWAEQHGLTVTSYADLARHPQVRELVRAAAQAANADLPPSAQVRRVAVLDRELSADEGELTPLGVPRRSVVLGRSAALVETLYGAGAPDEGVEVLATTDERAERLAG